MAAEVQALLRFLTKDARLPLQDAMSKISALRKQSLSTPDQIAKADPADLKSIFTAEKTDYVKQVINAAKRVSNPKKRSAAQASSSISKRPKSESDVVDEESLLAFPQTDLTQDELENVTIETNRAPLFLAFTIAVLAYTQPEQPLSSRWSMAQAVVSTGAQSKAKYLGLTSGPTAEEDGWAMGQPKIKIMGREVAVMRRHVVKSDEDSLSPTSAYWGLDLEALRRSNGPLIARKDNKRQDAPPIHTPIAPRNYLLKSMIDVQANSEDNDPAPKTKAESKKEKPAEIARRKEEAAAKMLKAIDIVCQSWAEYSSREELDSKAQTWYIRVRPDVDHGQAGWGQRGQVKLRDILQLKKG
ncbi:uncharacterized protein A1O9_01928 [Exophiala aquamarina CBS 119918]|uniref:Impact N-terminal domain-containing protein n=1 Tax=Exophiala aquamarina CBS 119918 TaxID=1182545 RepID=A0A072PM15_9EURO|nr:uncharacterized protein A1O9_01928 [Exophiala aquamarina CBS 119918]KEF60368.1 hypothetical protein A1O9_01928 [Exophiala aquamarina CBS 119918]